MTAVLNGEKVDPEDTYKKVGCSVGRQAEVYHDKFSIRVELRQGYRGVGGF